MRRTIRRGLKIARRDSSDCKSYTKSDTLSLPYLTPLFMSFLEELSLPCLQIINNTDSDSHGKMGHGRLSSPSPLSLIVTLILFMFTRTILY